MVKREMNFSAMTNEELLASTKVAAADEHTALSFVMEHLAEVQARRAYLDAGCTSLFYYCLERLHYSENRFAPARDGGAAARAIPCDPADGPQWAAASERAANTRASAR